MLNINLKDSIKVKTIEKNGMTVSWQFQNDRIYFTMTAPTTGWITIGFNASTNITGAYLIMGNVIKGKANVVEHYVHSPGNYKSLLELGVEPQIINVSGNQNNNETSISFSLPIKAANKYQKPLAEGYSYTLILAFSMEDDFQHHSVMRTSMNITL